MIAFDWLVLRVVALAIAALAILAALSPFPGDSLVAFVLFAPVGSVVGVWLMYRLPIIIGRKSSV